MTDSLAHRLFDTKAANDLAPAFIQGQSVVTHRQLRALVVACVHQLRSMGLSGGETIGLTMGQSPLFCVTQFALAVLGVVHFPLQPSLGRDEQRNLLEKLGARATLTDRELEPFPGWPRLVLSKLSVGQNEAGLEGLNLSVGPETPLSIALTSGTTGTPKGLLRTHASLLDRIDCSPMPLGPGFRLIPPDLHQAISQCYSLGMLLKGGALVFPQTYQLQDMIQAITLHGVTHLILSHAKAREMAELLPENAGALGCVSHLRLMGGHPSSRLLDMIRTRLTPNVTSHYGTTETGVIAVASADFLASHPDCAGTLHPPCQAIEMVDPQGQPVEAGMSGEVRIRSNHMPTGYLKDPDATSERFRNGWFYPGDIGHLDSEGRIFLHGRNDSVINIGGHKATAEHVEGVIENDDAVAEAGVVPIDDGAGGVVLAALVIPCSGATLEGLDRRCAAKLGVLAPKQVYRVETLPRTASGKLLRDLLRAQLPSLTANPDKG